MAALALLTAVVGLVCLTVLHRRDQRRVRGQRAEFFADCVSLVDEPRLTLDDFGYPKLIGKVDGRRIEADVVIDCVALRKLPSLWLRVTLKAPVATETVLDVMMRPSGNEFFSPFADLPDRIETPPFWPERAVIRTDAGDRLHPPEAIGSHVSILEEPKAKELIVAPNGVRIVWQADEAQRSDYLLLRQAKFEVVRFDPERFLALVDRCIKIRDAMEEAARSKEFALEAAV